MLNSGYSGKEGDNLSICYMGCFYFLIFIRYTSNSIRLYDILMMVLWLTLRVSGHVYW